MSIKWIPVDEKMSGVCGEYWVTYDGGLVTIAYYDDSLGRWDLDPFGDYHCYDVIAYAEIEHPEPYKTGKDFEEAKRQIEHQIKTDRFNKAKQLINDFCKREYGSEADFTNLIEIPILYSTYGDDEMIEVQVNVNLIDYEIVFLKRDNRNNEKEYSVYKTEYCDDLRQMIKCVLEPLDFNDLYAEYDFED